MTKFAAVQAQQQTRATPVMSGSLQRKCACGQHTTDQNGECTECGKKQLGLQRQFNNQAFAPRQMQAKLAMNRPGDKYEREADRVGEQVMRMPERGLHRLGDEKQGKGEHLRIRSLIHRQATDRMDSSEAPTAVNDALSSPGHSLDPSTRSFMEFRFGHDFSQVSVHTNGKAAETSKAVKARAFTVGPNMVFGAGEYAPSSGKGQRLIAHELAHVVQQDAAPSIQWVGDLGAKAPVGVVNSDHVRIHAVQCKEAPPVAEQEMEDVTEPLNEREWQLIEMWLNIGEVGTDPLTENAHENAETVSAAIFCGRMLTELVLNDAGEDPLLCIISDVTKADRRVQQLVHEVEARGPIVNWATVDPDQRMLHVMNILVNTYGYPVNGAAGLVGNLYAESGVLPNRIEGSARATPMRTRDFRGHSTDFTAEQVMNRNLRLRQGPRLPGIGLAQWTSANRRSGLFQHQFGGRQVGTAILFNMDAQVDYLVAELHTRFALVNAVLMRPNVSVDEASDEVVLNFETPLAVVAGGRRLPRTDPRVQAVFRSRRVHAQRALRVFNNAQANGGP
jgi:hypothetical protein